jgi:hypothetical protein
MTIARAKDRTLTMVVATSSAMRWAASSISGKAGHRARLAIPHTFVAHPPRKRVHSFQKNKVLARVLTSLTIVVAATTNAIQKVVSTISAA